NASPGCDRGPQGALSGVAGVLDEPDHLDRAAGGSDPDHVALFDALDPQGVVGPRLAEFRRRIRQATGRRLVAEQDDRNQIPRTASLQPSAELNAAQLTHLAHAFGRLDPATLFRPDTTPDQRV